ncbi:hypothetical protein NXC14_PC00681 (plasmid) [Rhizobium sp. NXC14]|nr:hypothetical protein NXC14_PC00681 [Rhizobium sp. NXC14]
MNILATRRPRGFVNNAWLRTPASAPATTWMAGIRNPAPKQTLRAKSLWPLCAPVTVVEIAFVDYLKQNLAGDAPLAQAGGNRRGDQLFAH